MQHYYTLIIVLTCSLTVLPAHANSQTLDSLVSNAVLFSTQQLVKTIATLGDTALFPKSTAENGRWKLVKPGDWTVGFLPGCLWLGFELTGDSSFVRHAVRWTEKLEPQKLNTKTHDIGFIMNCSFGNGQRLIASESYKPILLTAAQSLSTRFSSKVGCIRSWDNRKWPFPVIIDNMMNLELLFLAAKEDSTHGLYDLALTHALTTMKNHFRSDGSTYHVVSYDSATGAVLAKETHQGFAHESTWARGQAWAIYGFTMTYRETRDRRFLLTAERAADWFLAHLPADHVPYWDFSASQDEPRDASAAAIAASALFELAGLVESEDLRTEYAASAMEILSSLCRPPYLAVGSTSMGILNHATGNKPANMEVDVSLIYGDYYFLEGLVRYRKAGHTMGR